jgi:16S rRNA (adenine1518-N6/adenine1519-N6)-dimethyltransferase
MAQTLTDIRRLLEAHQLHPKHKWGQNFLHDHNHMQRILDAAAIAPGEVVLEVGAGTGALTERLLETGARVVAVEIDRELATILHERLDPFGEQATLHLGDVMADKRTLDPTVLACLRDQHAATGGVSPFTFKLVANLPYGVASPLLSTLAMAHPAMMRGVVMGQREVAERLIAVPGNKQYGPLGILVQAMCHVRRLANLPPRCFWPQPKVGSAVVQLDRRQTPLTDRPEALASLVHTLFTKRRKQLRAILGRATALPADVQPTQRPEQLSVEQLVALAAMQSRA